MGKLKQEEIRAMEDWRDPPPYEPWTDEQLIEYGEDLAHHGEVPDERD